MSPSLKDQHNLIAEILSFAIATPEDYARFRAVSPKWNELALSRALASPESLRICSRMNSLAFFQELVKLADLDNVQLTGKLCDVSGREESFECFQNENIEVESILFVRDKNYNDTSIEVSREEGYPGVVKDPSLAFADACKTLCSDRPAWEEFSAAADRAYQSGMFLSVEDFEHGKKTGDRFQAPSFEHRPYQAAVLTITRPTQGAWVVENPRHPGNQKVLLGAWINRDMDGMGEDGTGDYRAVPYVKHWEHTAPMDEKTNLATFVGHNVVIAGDRLTCQVPMMILLSEELEEELGYNPSRSFLPLKLLWSKFQEQSVREGVTLADGIVPADLHRTLVAQIDALAEQQILDYHPHSKNRVRDILHPALYSYVRGVSPVVGATQDVPPEVFATNDGSTRRDDEISDDDDSGDGGPADYWGRKYEASARYQWLPTYFDVDRDGRCTICDYINNLVPRSEHEDLYGSLGQLFSHALPLLESVYSYGRVVRQRHLRIKDDGFELEYDRNPPSPIREDPVSLRGRRLQVITKIVDYELAPGQTYEGVWHVEGMSHEEIVATAIYFVERDSDIRGGDILFKRAFHSQEAVYVFSAVAQCRPQDVEKVIEDGLVPLGKVETLPGRILVFPNSHVHKVTKLENTETPEARDSNNNNNNNNNTRESSAKRRSTTKKRRIVVFFLVNPEKRIVSTREVPMQQEHVGGSMRRTDALEHRLKLMKERKYTKQDYNVRHIELCEH